MSNKREPIFADRLAGELRERGALRTLTGNAAPYPPAFLDRVQMNLYSAKKFVLDSQAAWYLGNMVREHPGVIVDGQDFVIAPFERMWVEMPFRPFFTAVTGQIPDPRSDRDVGYLFVGNDVYVASWANVPDTEPLEFGSSILPIVYHLHYPNKKMLERFERVDIRLGDVVLDLFYWGETARQLADTDKLLKVMSPNMSVEDARVYFNEMDNAGNYVHGAEMEQHLLNTQQFWQQFDAIHSLRKNHSFELIDLGDIPRFDVFNILRKSSAGDLRNIVAMLLYLNRTHDVQVQREFGWHSTLVDRKPTRLMPYTSISMRLDPTPRLKKLSLGGGTKHRLHDVRGHYCHDKKARAGCVHGAETADLKDFGTYWEEYEPLRWKCSRCGGKRWWRKEHSRGSLDLGTVVQQYEVTR